MIHEATADAQVIPANIQPPSRPAVHGKVPRGLMTVPRSQFYEGRFGRMFRKLAPLQGYSEDDYRALADTMVDAGIDATGDNPDIPAGYTYLGQFVDHDITFDPTSKLQRDNDPNALQNFRTPRYDLDSVYGGGPVNSPFMYAVDGMHLLVEPHSSGNGDEDCPRVRSLSGERTRAIIGDPRNDENFIVNQLHLAFIKYHNAVVDRLVEMRTGSVQTAEQNKTTFSGDEREALFNRAQRIVRWHYQWLVVHDFLKRIVGEAVVDDLFEEEQYVVFSNGAGPVQGKLQKVKLHFYEWKHKPYMPVEFSVAAYRFGHSMIRAVYRLNTELVNFGAGDIVIFASPTDGQFALDHGLQLNPASMAGGRERPPFWEIEWNRFFDMRENDTDAVDSTLQMSRLIDTNLALGLAHLPEEPPIPGLTQLAARNLLRGDALKLPSGQAVAQAMGVPPELVLDENTDAATWDLPGSLGAALAQRVKRDTPLWYYILKEASVFANGRHLGPVGGRIVAEVFIGLLAGDPQSYYNGKPHWRPQVAFGAREVNGETVFGMRELLRFAGVKTAPSV